MSLQLREEPGNPNSVQVFTGCIRFYGLLKATKGNKLLCDEADLEHIALR